MLGLFQSEAQLNGLLELHALELGDGRVHGVPETPAVDTASSAQSPLKPINSAKTPVMHIGAGISRHLIDIPCKCLKWCLNGMCQFKSQTLKPQPSACNLRAACRGSCRGSASEGDDK